MSINLKSTIFVSLIWHIACFSIVELTFGKRIFLNPASFETFFLGSILQNSDYHSKSESALTDYPKKNATSISQPLRSKNSRLKPQDFFSELNNLPLMLDKPKDLIALAKGKITYFATTPLPETRNSAGSLLFHPLLPYHFLLYFKDRQTAHVEIMFYISSRRGKVTGLKRKISSANPEVDILVMRNLAHFLNLCGSNFATDSWQSVKIDLKPE